ncbi:MAG: DMT family transporter [Candidatus Puniceispirillaceae bacterium]
MIGRDDNLRGAMLMAVSMLCFVLNDGLMKALFDSMSIYQAILLRGVITVPVIAVMAWQQGALVIRLAARDRLLVAVRVSAEVGATVGFLTALKYMPLANVTAILQVLPLTVTMAAALFLGESVGWRRWLAILIGLVGVIIIIRPGMQGFSVYSIWALGAVGCITVREIVTRKLSSGLPSLPVALATAIAIGGLGAVMIPAVEWAPVSGDGWLLLAGASVAIIGGYLFSVMTMRVGDIGFVAPFRYTAMVWAIGLGLLMFGDLPDMATSIGTGIVIITGLYSLHRERRVRQTDPAPARQAGQDRD